MLINPQKIKDVFLRKTAFAGIVQIIFFCLMLVIIENYIQYSQAGARFNDLIISDDFTLQEIAAYEILNNTYALDLELYNLRDIRKLDYIKFFRNFTAVNNFSSCKDFQKGFKVCKGKDQRYFGISPVTSNNKTIGYLVTQKKYEPSLFLFPLTYDLFFIFLTAILGFLFNFIFVFFYLKKRIEKNTNRLLESMSKSNSDFHSISGLDIEEFRMAALKFSEEKEKSLTLEKQKASYTLASQVAHDIRSPLAVLEFATKDLAQIPEEHREMIRSSVSRINDIANNLLVEYRSNKNQEAENHLQAELIYVMLNNIISEKRLSCTHKNIELQFLPEENALGGFAKINTMQFKRVLSNLINNAAEAIENAGKIVVRLFKKDDLLVIEIEDNGCGIPEDILPKILDEGFSVGKEGGSGLGLSYTVSCIKSWGGTHTIFSRVQEGTRFVIFLPMVCAPQWFVEKIYLSSIHNIFILDDDASIHMVWKNRLEKIAVLHNITLKDFYTAKELITHVKKNSSNLQESFSDSLFFIDYELFGSAMNGLEVIQHLNIAAHAILVTSQYENETIREQCARLGVKILPKSYAAYIPVQANLKNMQPSQQIVFIDDNKRLTDAWVLQAERKNIPLTVFNKPSDLLKMLDSFAKDTVFYIDHDLGGTQSGEEIAKMLYNKGYKNLYLATGYEASCFKDLSFIKGVIGKMPIF